MLGKVICHLGIAATLAGMLVLPTAASAEEMTIGPETFENTGFFGDGDSHTAASIDTHTVPQDGTLTDFAIELGNLEHFDVNLVLMRPNAAGPYDVITRRQIVDVDRTEAFGPGITFAAPIDPPIPARAGDVVGLDVPGGSNFPLVDAPPGAVKHLFTPRQIAPGSTYDFNSSTSTLTGRTVGMRLILETGGDPGPDPGPDPEPDPSPDPEPEPEPPPTAARHDLKGSHVEGKPGERTWDSDMRTFVISAFVTNLPSGGHSPTTDFSFGLFPSSTPALAYSAGGKAAAIDFLECVPVDDDGVATCPVPGLRPRDGVLYWAIYTRKELELSGLGPGRSAHALGTVKFTDGDTDADNNFYDQRIDFLSVGDSELDRLKIKRNRRGSRLAATGSGAGTARSSAAAPDDAKPKSMHFALVKIGKGQHAMKGDAFQLPSGTVEPPRCKWLADKRGRFKYRPSTADRCDNPKWIKAKPKGKKRKGKFVLKLKGKRKLPYGKYVLYSRVTSKSGGQEVSFTRKDKNRLQFRLKRERG